MAVVTAWRAYPVISKARSSHEAGVDTWTGSTGSCPRLGSTNTICSIIIDWAKPKIRIWSRRTWRGCGKSRLPLFLKYATVGVFACTWKLIYYAPTTFQTLRQAERAPETRGRA